MASHVETVPKYNYDSNHRLVDGDNRIRLINILPQNDGELLRIILEPHELDEVGLSYVALSYTWGSPLNPKTILCDGASMEVTANLFSALLRLRGALHNEHRPLGSIVPFNKLGSDICPIWIDAICINQQDDDERTAQVRIMDKIYRNARRVIIWLGEEQEEREVELCFIAAEVIAGQHLYKKGTREVLPGSTDELHVARLKQLLRKPWFSRVWVFQEVALAREAVVLFDTLSINWMFVAFAVTALQTLYEFPKGYVGDQAEHTFDAALLNVMGISLIQATRENPQGSALKTLANCMQMSRVNHATDPRDKVFAYLNVATQTGQLKANYKKTLAEVYTDCAWALIEETSSLELLTYTQAGHRGHDLPSWVPDWRVPTILHPIAWGEDRENRTYRAAGDDAFDIFSHADRAELVLKGVRCGGVEKIIAYELPEIKEEGFRAYMQAHVDTPGDDLYHCFGTLAEQLGLSGRHETTQEPMTMAFIRTLTADLLPDNCPRQSSKRYYPAYMQRYGLCEPSIDASETDLLLRAIKEIRSKAKRLLEGRCLAMTSDGCLALMPDVAVLSDEIFLVKGSTSPLLLRQKGNGWEYIGETYVHGAMQGELIEWANVQEWNKLVIK